MSDERDDQRLHEALLSAIYTQLEEEQVRSYGAGYDLTAGLDRYTAWVDSQPDQGGHSATADVHASAVPIRFRLLGPLEVRVGEQWEAIGAPKWRSLLAALLINSGQIVSTETLIDEVWGDDEPAKAANLVSIYVLRLRRLIGDTSSRVLVTHAPGYLLRAAPETIDSQLFEKMVRDGRKALTAGEPQRAAEQLAGAVALWRGSPLADVARSQVVEAEAERLVQLKLDADELRITAALGCGGHAQVVPELRRLLADNQLREGLWLLLMKALDGSGRRAEALDTYGQARKVISSELGVDPGPELRQLYAELLAADSSSAAPRPGRSGTVSRGCAR